MSNQKIEIHAYIEYVLVDIDVMDDQRLTPIEKLTFLQLCRFANSQTSQCYPSVKKLAEKVNCSERAVQNALKKLEELHLICRTPSFNGGRQTATIYTVIGHKDGYYAGNRGRTSCTPPCTSCTDGGESGAHRTITIGTNNTLTREAQLPENAESEKSSDTEGKNQSDPDRENEHFAPKAAPSIMQPTARYLLQRTGRKYLTREEILALRELAASQMPARVQKEIDRACERFTRQNKPLSSLRVEYIASALRNQPTFGKKKKSKAERDKLKKDCEELKPKEIIKPANDEEFNAMLARIEALQNQTRGDNQA